MDKKKQLRHCIQDTNSQLLEWEKTLKTKAIWQKNFFKIYFKKGLSVRRIFFLWNKRQTWSTSALPGHNTYSPGGGGRKTQ